MLLFGEAMSDSTGAKQSNIGRAAFLAALGEVEFDETYQHLHLTCSQPEAISVHLLRNKGLRQAVQEKLTVTVHEAKQSLQTDRSSLQLLSGQLMETGRVDGRELSRHAAFISSG